MIELPWEGLTNVLGALPPGLHALTGPIGCGKTQLSLQVGLHAAATQEVLLLHPWIPESEILRRLAGIVSRTAWPTADPVPPPQRLAVGGARAPMEALVTEEKPLFVVDHPQIDERMLSAARRVALEKQAAVLLVVEPSAKEAIRGYVPAEIRNGPTPDIALWLGLAPRLVSEVDTLLAVAPYRARTHSRWSPIDLVIAKNRRGPLTRCVLRFNGFWFEDEPEEDIDLGL